MARTKDYKAKTPTASISLAADFGASNAMLALPPNPRNHKVIDLNSWLGRGFDEWVWAAITILKARLQSGNYSVATIGSFASNGIKVFLPYLMENVTGSVPSRPCDMTPADVARYIEWLRRKYPNGSTAKNYYSAFKSVVVGLMDYGFIDEPNEALLPANRRASR